MKGTKTHMWFIILLYQDDWKLLPSLCAEGEGPGERPAPVLRVGEAEADDAAGVKFNRHLEFRMQIWNRL